MDGKRAQRAAQWRAHVLAWRDSGQTQAAYCAAQGLSVSTLGGWISRLRKGGEGADGAPLTLVAARAIAPPAGSLAEVAQLTVRSPSGWSLIFDARPP